MPFYDEKSEEVYEDQDRAIEINERGEIIFGKVLKNAKSLVWNCCEALCALGEGVISNLGDIYEYYNRKHRPKFT